MKQVLILIINLAFYLQVQGLTDLLKEPITNCITCLCHSITNCWEKQNCAQYALTKDMWMQASSPVLDPADDPNSDQSYSKCMQDDNCIVHTIKEYTDTFNQKDCNCNGEFNCFDRLALVRFKENCENPKFARAHLKRFRTCAIIRHISYETEIDGDCKLEDFN